jgi:hypothetical protein
MHVHDIRPGRSCDQEIVQSVKKVVGIIAAQGGLRRQSQSPRSRHRTAVRQGPSGENVATLCAALSDSARHLGQITPLLA